MAQTTIKLEVNDILYSSWGYDQTNIDYYKVKRLVGKTMVEVVQIESKLADEQTSFTTNSVIPYPAAEYKKTYKRKIHTTDPERPGVMISSFQWASLWDGNPKHETDSHYGH